jgi:hypothetical protein
VPCIVHPKYGPHPLYLIYVVRGPSGVYVGCTRNIKRRWRKHRASAVSKPGLLYEAMRRDGAKAHSCEVVACSGLGERSAESAEEDLVRQLRADGEYVFNVLPRDGFYPGRVRAASVVQDVARARKVVATELRYMREFGAMARDGIAADLPGQGEGY